MRKPYIALGATVLALVGVVGGTGPASANSDSYSRFGTTLYGYNYYGDGGYVIGEICNNQSAPNDFNLWIRDAATGRTINGRWPTGTIRPGYCETVGGYVDHYGDPIQVFGQSSGNWTYGTDPIYPS